MTALLAALDQKLFAAMRARERLRVEALRMLKSQLMGARDDADARRRLARYRRACLELLEQYSRLGAEPLTDRLVMDVGVCDGLVPPLSPADTEQLVTTLARTLRLGPDAVRSVEPLIGAAMRAAPGQLDGRAVREVATRLFAQR
jgi:hypothetical protein